MHVCSMYVYSWQVLESRVGSPASTIRYWVMAALSSTWLMHAGLASLSTTSWKMHLLRRLETLMFSFSVDKIFFICLCLQCFWRCWLGGRKGIRPVKNWVVGCWHGYLTGARCRLAYGPADATATHCLLLQWHPDWFYLSGTGSPG